MDYRNLITQIKSVRDYKKTLISPQIINEIKDFYKNERKLVSDIEIEVFVKNRDEVYEQLKGIAGYKEKMIDAPHYLIVLSDEKEYYIQNTGYVCQHLMLKAYELGVDSCWITFKDADVIKQKLMINSNKKLTALVSLGYDGNKTKIINQPKLGDNPSKAAVMIVQDNTSYRLGVEDVVFIKQWGKHADIEDLKNRGILDGFHYARLAPSTLNRQPWRFIVDDNIIVLAFRSDKFINEYEEKIDTGIVMLFFESIIDNTLFDVTWTMGKPDKEYMVPDDFLIVGYCNI